MDKVYNKYIKYMLEKWETIKDILRIDREYKEYGENIRKCKDHSENIKSIWENIEYM